MRPRGSWSSRSFSRTPGRARPGSGKEGALERVKVTVLYSYDGLSRNEVGEASAGDIVALAGAEGATIGDTVSDAENPRALPRIAGAEPPGSMVFSINTS